MKKALLALVLAFPLSAFAGDAAPAGDPRIAKIADALQSKGSNGAIDAWRVRDLGLPYSGEAAVPIKIESFSEDIGGGKKRIYTVSTLTIGKRFLTVARGTGTTTYIVLLDDEGKIVGGRVWSDTGNRDAIVEMRQFIVEKDIPTWLQRLGVE